jgi:dihydroorotate dehydrogenase (fumarate)
MDLSTTYLGLTLAHPFMAGASPLAGTLDSARRLEDGGAAALVLHSLFEEQVTMESRGTIHHRDPHDSQFAAALAHFPAPDQYALTPGGYLEHIRRLKGAVRVPVMASLNGTSSEAWLRLATDIEQAGADALEINIYDIVSDPAMSAMSVETYLRDLVVELKRTVRIPVALKLLPYYTSLGNVARRLDEAGVDGLILFNRSCQLDVNLDTMTIAPVLEPATQAELRLRLKWATLLHGRVRASIAITGGVSVPDDGVKAVLAGADAVQMVSAVLVKGAAIFREMRAGLAQFMAQQEFESVNAMKGLAGFARTEDPASFERANYIRTLQSLVRARHTPRG